MVRFGSGIDHTMASWRRPPNNGWANQPRHWILTNGGEILA
ncbi:MULTISPECIES: hypothetical protein [unclassified Hwanghaeella]